MSSLLPLRYAWRSLRRSPGFTIAAALTLALGIGATTAIFTVVNAVLLRPLAYIEPERLVGAWHAFPGIGLSQGGQSPGTYFVNRQLTGVFDSFAAYRSTSVSLVSSRGADPERVRGAQTSASLFPLLGVSPLHGRVIAEAEDRPGGSAVVIIGEGLWRRRFGGDPSLVGQTIHVDGAPREVIGIMPRSFRFPDADAQLWLPLPLDPAGQYAGGFDFDAVGRLRAGVSLTMAQGELQRAISQLPERYPELAPGLGMAGIIENTKMRAVLRPLREDVIGAFAQVLWVVAATAGLVLLVACANVANLLLVRAEGRHKELAVRAALGAGRAQKIGHFLAEGIVLAGIGGVLGIALAASGVGLLVRYGPREIPRLSEVGIDGAALLFALLLTFSVALFCSVLPAIRGGASSLGAALREGGRSGTAGRGRQRVRGALVAVQVALALVLLSGSGLLVRSVWQLQGIRPGFDPANVLTLRLELSGTSYGTEETRGRFYTQLVDRVGALSGVRAAAVVSKLPLQQDGMNLNPMWTEDDPAGPNEMPPVQTFVRVSGDYFRAMGIGLVAGRTFDRTDGRQSPFEVIVSRGVAATQWGDSTGQRAIGERLRTLSSSGIWFTVIGVVESVRDTSLTVPGAGNVYFPAVADTNASRMVGSLSSMTLVVKTIGDPRALAGAVVGQVHALDPSLPVFNVRAMDDVVSRSFARVSFTLVVIAVAAGVALLLGAIGLYGVIAYVVSLRTREIGVRIALGAQPAAVSRAVTRQSTLLALAGVGVGLVIFILLGRPLRALLYGVSPADPVTLATVSLLLVLVAALASWIPARRAARVDPVEALRAE